MSTLTERSARTEATYMKHEGEPNISDSVVLALDKLGYRKRVFRRGALHARRGRDHLIIRLSRHGTAESIKAHIDITRSGILGPRRHKAVYGKVAEELEAEFRMAYESSKSSSRRI